MNNINKGVYMTILQLIVLTIIVAIVFFFNKKNRILNLVIFPIVGIAIYIFFDSDLRMQFIAEFSSGVFNAIKICFGIWGVGIIIWNVFRLAIYYIKNGLFKNLYSKENKKGKIIVKNDDGTEEVRNVEENGNGKWNEIDKK
jgi:c-di-AMP phosphodiesterase-like protein